MLPGGWGDGGGNRTLPQNKVLPEMDANMSEETRREVIVKLRSRYGRAGFKYRVKLIDQAVDLFGYHRKSAIRVLSAPARVARPRTGRPPRYDAAAMLPALKAIWLAGQQPCGKRLAPMMPDWIAGY